MYAALREQPARHAGSVSAAATGDTVPLVDPSDVHLLVAACCYLGAYEANCVRYVDPARRTAENIHEHVNNITPQLSLPERIVA